LKPNPHYTDPISNEGRAIRQVNQYDHSNKLDEPNRKASQLTMRASSARRRFDASALDRLSRGDAIKQAFEIGFLTGVNNRTGDQTT